MFDVSNEYPIPEKGLGHKGLPQVLREMGKGDSFEIPVAKKDGIYSAAKAAGAKVRTRTTDKGTIRVWRIDGEALKATPDDGMDIFGQPIKKDVLS